jgi:hypothetical protein
MKAKHALRVPDILTANVPEILAGLRKEIRDEARENAAS